MGIRSFSGESALTETGLALAVSPALTPAGIDPDPSFFHGFATQPLVLARGLLTLADVTATRYFQYTPSHLRDPVLTAHGDRLRVECFSACNGVYARLDLMSAGFDGGDIAYGTTNVDIGVELRSALTGVGRHQLLHLDIGRDGLTAASLASTVTERPVMMPDRWIRALGNVAELHRSMTRVFSVGRLAAVAFLASVPSATGVERSGWLSPGRDGVRVTPLPRGDSVHVTGLHRLSAAKRLLPHVEGLTFYGPADRHSGPAVIEIRLPSSRLTIGLTEETWRGHSGEGSLLTALASTEVLDDAGLLSGLLAFEPVIDVARLARDAALSFEAVTAGLAVIASSGRVGWDAYDEAYFHRELPDDPEWVNTDNPRLVGARRLVEMNAVRPASGVGAWIVGDAAPAAGRAHIVRLSSEDDRCTCTWYLKHGGSRGPCKHVLAVRMIVGEPA